jgi:hypothetical protein
MLAHERRQRLLLLRIWPSAAARARDELVRSRHRDGRRITERPRGQRGQRDVVRSTRPVGSTAAGRCPGWAAAEISAATARKI